MRFINLLIAACVLATVRPSLASAVDSQVDRIVEKDQGIVPGGFTVRARVTAIEPAEPVSINWRHGGEGLGGKPIRGTFGEKLEVGEWSPAVSVRSMMPGGGKFPAKFFLTCTAGNGGRLEKSLPGREREMAGGSKNVQFEFEFRWNDKVVKTLHEIGPTSGTVGLVIPAGLLSAERTPDHPQFLERLTGLLEYSQRRADRMEALPWAKQPVPKRYAIQTDLGGYGQGIYYGIRTTDPAVIEAECRTLRQLGINGLRNAPGFLLDRVEKRDELGTSFSRLRDIAAMGFPVAHAQKGKADDPEAGCPFAPGVAERTRTGIQESIDQMSRQPVSESWGLTVDEIGSVYDHAAEGKAHLTSCPRCADAFRAHLKAAGLSPADFGKPDWSQVSPLNIYAKDFLLDHPDRTTGLLAYHTASFPIEASAKLFTPLRDRLAAMNEQKRTALAGGKTSGGAAARPWLYSYALRGNTFLMGGHSLDFFDFYRWSDNAFVYETSNRDPRVWQWDSYLCDVGRVMSAERNLRFGIYVKPHRGAPIQRALSAAARGAKMFYWYTYGPDWAKGDTFAADDEALDQTSRAARLLAAAEEVSYGAAWPTAPEVAIVTPRSSELWMRLSGNPPDRVAAWENAKWTYTALSHSHIPLDPVDEGMLAEESLEQLSRYKVMYILGPNLTTAAAQKVAKWVEAGGVLYTCAGGLRFDEANQPLTILQDALGLSARTEPKMWKRVQLYGATNLESWDEPSRKIAEVPNDASIAAAPFAPKGLSLVVGREVLDEARGVEVLAKFADGKPAVTRHPVGKGSVYIAGIFAGLEYSAPMRASDFDGTHEISAAARALAAIACGERVKPVVDCNVPKVEAVLVENPQSRKRAIFVMNWPVSAKEDGASILNGVSLSVRSRTTEKVRDAASGQELKATTIQGGFSITIPTLHEGTVLLLDE